MMWAIVPAKILEQAKSRLASLLTPTERRALSQAMLADVLGALKSAPSLDQIAVVTADARLAAQARALEAVVVAETGNGQNAALEVAAAFCTGRGAEALLVVSADVPLVRAEVVEQLLEVGRQQDCLGSPSQPRVVLAPSADGSGTNALFLRPPGSIPFLFGPQSLPRHQQVAWERGAQVTLFQARDLALDIDTPTDVDELLRLPAQTQTQAVLREMRLGQRLHDFFCTRR